MVGSDRVATVWSWRLRQRPIGTPAANWTGGVRTVVATGVACLRHVNSAPPSAVTAANDSRHDPILQQRRYSSAINVNSTLDAQWHWCRRQFQRTRPTFNVAQGGTGSLSFQNAATAGDAVINTETGGTTSFSGTSNGGSSAHSNANGTGVVDFSGTYRPERAMANVTAGSPLRVPATSSISAANTLTVSAPTGTFSGNTLVPWAARVVSRSAAGTQTLSGHYLANYTGVTTIDSRREPLRSPSNGSDIKPTLATVAALVD